MRNTLLCWMLLLHLVGCTSRTTDPYADHFEEKPNNTAGGENNSDTISAVTVDFSEFGGGAAVVATDNGSGSWFQ